MDETAELIRLGGRAIVAMLAEAPEFEARLTRDCALALSGEPVADLNMMFVGDEPAAERFLTDAVARAAERALPLLAALSPRVGEALAPVAERAGLIAAGTLPLMVLHASAPVQLGKPCQVERALSSQAVKTAGDLVAAAFDLPRASVANALDASLTETAGAEAYVALNDGAAMSAVTVTRTGATAGVWCMATPPEHQGKGMGRALLSRVIDRLQRQGVDRFFLLATPAGRPLYESLGFALVADCPTWVLDPSGQAHG
jgi:GNAT superfamily N-acetyltransferase